VALYWPLLSPRHILRLQTPVEESRSPTVTSDPLSRSLGALDTRARDRNHRLSLPVTPLTPSYRRLTNEELEILRGPAYYGNVWPVDCFVVARSLRRPSDTASGEEERSKDSDVSWSRQVTIRARVRPMEASQRKPFVLQRVFDREELSATALSPRPRSVEQAVRRVEELASSPMQARRASTSIVAGQKSRRSSSRETAQDQLNDGGEPQAMRMFQSLTPIFLSCDLVY
jgi:hypothetical protein